MNQNLRHQGIYLNLVDNAEGIIIPGVREYYLYQGVGNSISAIGRSFEGIVEVGCWVFDRSMTTKDYETGNADALIQVSDGHLSQDAKMTYNTRLITLTMPMPLDSR